MTETLSLFDEIFSETGLLSQHLSSYESREGQQRMAGQIWKAFEQNQIALFEAGTGIGKSLAYLIPALLWSYRTGEKIVVSTYTIALQEQLLEKDLPLLLEVLGVDLHVVLAKGMGNYLCLRKLDEISKQHGFFDQTVDALVDWSRKSKDGTKSAIPFGVSGETWNKVYAESEACSYVKCPHYKQCFFFKARAKVQDADLIIINHHLLMSHLLAENDRAILPPFSRLIVDEAHHLENVARSSLTQVLDRVQLFKFLGQLHSDTHPQVSRFFHIRDIVKDKTLKSRLDIDLPGERRELFTRIHAAFDLLDQISHANSTSNRWRITTDRFQSKRWQEELIPIFIELKEHLERFIEMLQSIPKEIEETLKPKVENALLDIAQSVTKLKEIVSIVNHFFSEEKEVRWVEKTTEGAILSITKLDVGAFLEERLFTSLKSTILCSATLAVNGSFAHIRKNLGLPEEICSQIYPSPFDFQNRARLFGIIDLPLPNAFSFISEASKVIRNALEISNGGAFVLFTSYDMLQKCADELSDFPILQQGSRSRHLLLEEFKQKKNAILFGTDSFWEGVDVAGDALRLVIIVKLPFPVPTDPFLEARSELLRSEGRDPFMEDSVPQAVMKFKQGFGRLIRKAEDRGCILCLDQRLFNRPYGKIFIQSLPECIVSYEPQQTILNEMESFYENLPT